METENNTADRQDTMACGARPEFDSERSRPAVAHGMLPENIDIPGDESDRTWAVAKPVDVVQGVVEQVGIHSGTDPEGIAFPPDEGEAAAEATASHGENEFEAGKPLNQPIAAHIVTKAALSS